ncbi:hypothetical protein [Arthrobacter sp. ERGS1:01]|uniref:hypothetical protein n=1 Tax=Arthrobacter sp. ERGS1:01 TaxID=1704044 RepID=UPI001364CFA5|nr:hypothetical protein [Arthrobacter sp. ERGS1:01]
MNKMSGTPIATTYQSQSIIAPTPPNFAPINPRQQIGASDGDKRLRRTTVVAVT